jgi:hypothetical protein
MGTVAVAARLWLFSTLLAGGTAEPSSAPHESRPVEMVDRHGLARAKLRVESDAEGRCLGEAGLRAKVTDRLGADPFQDPPDLELQVSQRRVAGGYRAVLERRDGAGNLVGSQQLTAPGTDCSELSDALALALSIAIDPLILTRSPGHVEVKVVPWPRPETADAPAPVSAVPPASAPEEAPPTVQQVDATSPSREPLDLRLGIGGVGVLGLTPSPAAGLELQGEIHKSRYSLAIAGEATTIAGQTADSTGTVQAAFFGGAIMPCIHWRSFGFCGRVAAGADVSSSSNLPDAVGTKNTLYLGVGARVFADVPLTPAFSIRPLVTAEVPLVRTALEVGTATLWQTSPVAGSAGLQVVARLP